jgi:sugar/nucleoside kinase (ribokinase family)
MIRMFCSSIPLEEVFDPTGAGDTFAGGFAGYLTQSENILFENMKTLLFKVLTASFV